MNESVTLIKAGAIADATGDKRYLARPGWLYLIDGKVKLAGPPELIQSQISDASKNCRTIDWTDQLVMPAMVNCHAHLDLSNISPYPFDGSFTNWLLSVIQQIHRSKTDIQNAVHTGIQASLSQGVGYLADIAGSCAAIEARIEKPLRGVSYLEKFGLHTSQDEIDTEIKMIQDLAIKYGSEKLKIGIEPHAPYSAGKRWFQACHLAHLPVSTHLAETQEEIQFCRDLSGPFLSLLKKLDKKSPDKPWHLHPVEALEAQLNAKWILAHCNYLDQKQIEILNRSEASVAYCPVASSYFQHDEHPYMKLIDAGVNCTLGTDSIICQPAHPQPMSMLEQMRFLYHRDKTSPELLLKMATINGHLALNSPNANGSLLNPGGLIHIAFDLQNPEAPLTQILKSELPISSVHWLENF